jgi:hypothetical protein
VAGRDGLDGRDAVARKGGELPAAVKGCVPVAGARFGGLDGCSPPAPPWAGAGQDRVVPWTQMHGRVVWSGLDGQDAVIGAAAPCAAAPCAAAVLTGPLGAQMMLAATGSNRGRLTFRSGRGRSSGRSGADAGWGSCPRARSV